MTRPAEASVIVRDVKPADFEAWLPLWLGYNAFYGRSGDTALDAAVTDQTWARFFDPAEPVNGLVAQMDGRLVGLAHFIYHRVTTSITPTCYLNYLFTDETVRGAGIGRVLIDELYRRAAAAGSPRVYWLTHETNATAMRLYDKVAHRSGFVQYAQKL